ncbi:MAG: sigma-70 family RNA polymerase sigma factor [Bacteroidota bacterium]
MHINQHLSAYLLRAVANRCYNVIRDKKSRNEILKRQDHLLTNDTISDQWVIFTSLAGHIQHLLTKLPSRCREVFLMSRWQHKSHKEIASQLGISKKAVEKQITKAIQFLRSRLNDHLNTFFIFYQLEI